MGMPSKSELLAPRRRLSPDQRRAELVAAAERVLRRYGPTDCRVEDITIEANTAKGNFYRYFPTWDDLLIAVRDHLMEGYARGVQQRSETRGTVDWWESLAEEVDCFLDFQLGLGRLHDAVFHGPVSQARPIAAGHSAAALIAAFISGGIAARAFGTVDVEPTAALLFSVLHGAADEIAAGADRVRVRKAAIHIIERTLDPARL
jgi:AcrR family transcriptional regulator